MNVSNGPMRAKVEIMVTAIEKQKSNQMVIDGNDTSMEVRAATVEVESQQAIAKIQGALTIARKFPRDENAAYAAVMQACKRIGLAEDSQYSFPRGGQTVTGPSIHLLKTIARCWGNLKANIEEVQRHRGFSECRAFAWDMQTNYEFEIKFTVRHVRDTRRGIEILTDERDIYELIANMGSRRLRACLESVVPKDLVDDAVAECDRTLQGDGKEPLADRIKKMAAGFLDLGVNTEMLEAKLGHKLSATSEKEIVSLRKTFVTIRDGQTSAAEAFAAQLTETAKEAEKKTRTEELKTKMQEKTGGAPGASAPGQQPPPAREPGSDDDKDETSSKKA